MCAWVCGLLSVLLVCVCVCVCVCVRVCVCARAHVYYATSRFIVADIALYIPLCLKNSTHVLLNAVIMACHQEFGSEECDAVGKEQADTFLTCS